MATPPFTISFDYRCPFAKIMHLHVLTALRSGDELDVTFAPWSLNQAHRHDGDPDVWDDSKRDPDLLALAAGVSVRDRQPDLFLEAHEALFRARHDHGITLKTEDEVYGVLAGVGVNVDDVRADVEDRRPHEVIGQSHHDLARYEPFGVPTFFVADDAVFVRYMDNPTDDPTQSVDLVHSLLAMITDRPSINEFKHTRLSA